MHANLFRWVWPLQFRRFCLIFHFQLAIVILLLIRVFPHSLPLLYLQIKSDIKRRHTLLPKSFSDAASSNSISSFIMSSNPMKVI